jgi:hypothetical protein
LYSLKGRDHSKDVSVDRRIILKWILEKNDLEVLIGFVWIRVETFAGLS